MPGSSLLATTVTSVRWCSWSPSFFFQAEDGIRYSSVTGVQTCALPISPGHAPGDPRIRSLAWAVLFGLLLGGLLGNLTDRLVRAPGFGLGHVVDFLVIPLLPAIFNKIGRASCRERV